jgi:hypothetical protein
MGSDALSAVRDALGMIPQSEWVARVSGAAAILGRQQRDRALCISATQRANFARLSIQMGKYVTCRGETTITPLLSAYFWVDQGRVLWLVVRKYYRHLKDRVAGFLLAGMAILVGCSTCPAGADIRGFDFDVMAITTRRIMMIPHMLIWHIRYAI